MACRADEGPAADPLEPTSLGRGQRRPGSRDRGDGTPTGVGRISSGTMQHRVAALCLAGLCALALRAPAGAEPPALRVGLPALPASLDPATALEGPIPFVSRQVYDTLVQYRDGSSDVEAALAIQWTVSRQGLSWIFRLREGVRLHDGSVLTAAQVVASLRRVLFPGPRAPNPNVAPRASCAGPRRDQGRAGPRQPQRPDRPGASVCTTAHCAGTPGAGDRRARAGAGRILAPHRHRAVRPAGGERRPHRARSPQGPLGRAAAHGAGRDRRRSRARSALRPSWRRESSTC